MLAKTMGAKRLVPDKFVSGVLGDHFAVWVGVFGFLAKSEFWEE